MTLMINMRDVNDYTLFPQGVLQDNASCSTI